jgi:hypothetical protein
VKIVPAAIAGAATVLAAMMPLYFSSKKHFEAAAQVADVEADALRTQVQKLRSQVQQCEAAKAQFALKAGTSTTIPPVATNTSNEFVDHDFRFSLVSCKFVGSEVRCEFTVVNLMGDRELSLGEARFIDDSGNEYPSRGFTLGAQSGSFARMILPGAIPIRGSVIFASVRPGTKQIELLEMTGYSWPAGGSRETVVAKFQKIPLQ